jgi:very-long-chain (3R)-3-hydroxyacyl-CoA dehydratase
MRVKSAYLVSYNVAQFCGWLLVLIRACETVAKGDAGDVYASVRNVLVMFQVASFAEVLHAGLRLTPSPVGAALMQWFGRTHVLLCVLDATHSLWSTLAASVLVLAWALTEIIRYPSYAGSILGKCPKWLNWLRYTIFIPLYPLGAGAEMKLMYDVRATATKTNMYKVAMPNKYNFGFDYVVFLNGLLIIYPFLFHSLYAYMFAQRRKKLRGEKVKLS